MVLCMCMYVCVRVCVLVCAPNDEWCATNLEPDEDRSCRIGGGGLLVWLSLRLEGCHVILLGRSNRGTLGTFEACPANQSPSPSSSLGDGKATGRRNGGLGRDTVRNTGVLGVPWSWLGTTRPRQVPVSSPGGAQDWGVGDGDGGGGRLSQALTEAGGRSFWVVLVMVVEFEPWERGWVGLGGERLMG